MKYVPRLVDKKLHHTLKNAGAVLIKGPKACGKTWSASQLAKSVLEVDTDAKVKTFMSFEPRQLLQGDTPRLLDEWQMQPELWNYVRREVDLRQKPGQFILTGSANPVSNPNLHSGVGRFSILPMKTLSWLELGISTGSVSLGKLLSGGKITGEILDITLRDLLTHLIIGGWPRNLEQSLATATANNKDYVDLLVNADVSRVSGKERDPVKVRALLQSLARNIATTVEQSTLAQDVRLDSGNLARSTVDDYLEVLETLMIVDNQPAFNLHIRSTAELRKTPKRHLTDPSLAISLLNLDEQKLFDDPEYVGFLFESQVFHDLLIYANMNEAGVYYHRDSNGNEVDAIVENRAGNWAAFEVKLGSQYFDEAAKNLLRLQNNIDTKKTPTPKSLNIITGMGTTYTRPDGVNVISLASLGV